ncbi:Class E vacuolar protein-sorting machinery protein HSE1 [[Candida] zeylanoides]
MFRRSTTSTDSTLEHLIKRATDETLTADNWQYILEVCDKISQDPERLIKQAIQCISTRLALRDANVNLRALSLVVAVAENCGSRMQQEIATASFLNDVLIKKLADRRVHVTVKHKVAEVITQLHQSFKGDPSLKPISDVYEKMVRTYPQYVGAGARGDAVAGPNKPAKHEILQSSKAKEEEELQRVLKESLQEHEREEKLRRAYLNKPLPVSTSEVREDGGGAAQQTSQASRVATPPEQTIATVTKVRALYDLISYEPDELSFRKNDIITVLESVYRDWWKGSLPNGKVGIFPLNYVTPVVAKSPEELSQELELEHKILTVDSKRVDKLLALLTAPPQDIDEDEVTRLYNEIVPIRPTLGKFIDKYGVRREELLSLNGKLNREAKLYNELMDTSISQRAHHTGQLSGTNPPYPYSQPQWQQQPPQQQQQQQQQPTQQRQRQFPQFTHQQQQLSQPQQYSPQQHQISAQPTSSGFGNGGSPQPPYQQYPAAASQPFFQTEHEPQSDGNRLPYPQQPSYPPQSDHFSNVNRFPEVNQM